MNLELWVHYLWQHTYVQTAFVLVLNQANLEFFFLSRWNWNFQHPHSHYLGSKTIFFQFCFNHNQWCGQAGRQTYKNLSFISIDNHDWCGIAGRQTHTHTYKYLSFISVHNLDFFQWFRASKETLEKLKKTAKQELNKDGILATKLSTHKDDVEIINQSHLQKLNGKIHSLASFVFNRLFDNFMFCFCL